MGEIFQWAVNALYDFHHYGHNAHVTASTFLLFFFSALTNISRSMMMEMIVLLRYNFSGQFRSTREQRFNNTSNIGCLFYGTAFPNCAAMVNQSDGN